MKLLKQKDYWNISKRNFRAMAVVTLLVMFLFIAGGALPGAAYPILFLALSFIVFVITTILFKKHSPKAVIVAYIYTGLTFIYVIIFNFILSPSPLDGLFYKMGGLLVLFYLFNCVYKASKQTNSSIN
jgi:hypothetical protein